MRSTIVSILMVLLLAACGEDYDAHALKRTEFARQATGDIVVAVVDDVNKSGYLNGVEMAIQEINASPEKLLGRKVRLLKIKDKAKFADVRPDILSVARNPEVTAVLGHRTSSIATPASAIYESSKLVFMPSFATEKRLTGHDFQYVFRMLPNASVMAGQLASLAQTLGYKRMVILYSRDDYSREFSYVFEEEALNHGISFAFKGSFSAADEDYRKLISQFRNQRYDAVFLCTSTEPGARLLKQLRDLGGNSPVIGSDSLNSRSFLDAAGAAGDGTIVPIIYNPDKNSLESRQFIESYKARMNKAPDYNVAQGYDSARLLAHAIRRTGSTDPTALSSTLHFLSYWTGLTGVHAFNPAGDVRGKKLFFQVLKNGKWFPLEGLHEPYLLEAMENEAGLQQRKITRFSQEFAKPLSPRDLHALQLDLAREILKFDRLGVILPDDGNGQALLTKAQELAKSKGFSIESCLVPPGDGEKLKQELMNCYGRLALANNAIEIYPFSGIDDAYFAKLHAALHSYKIPAFMLGGPDTLPPGLALAIGRLNGSFRTGEAANLMANILVGMKVFELADKTENLPVIKVNLPLLDEYGILRRSPLLSLAPDSYIH